jgi:tetratricopeptide (TPR) repeat protein
MSRAIAKLKDRARAFEQTEEWEKAISSYAEILKTTAEDPELGLFNRVGDLYLKVDKPADAVRYYEQAADHYAEQGLYNNAIALCNKALRYQPNRNELLLKLGQYSAAQGFFTDARRWFLQYAERMMKAGHLDKAFAALEEFARISEDAEVQEMLARQLLAHGRQKDALVQLKEAYALRVRAGEAAQAAALRSEILQLDPGADLAQEPSAVGRRVAGVDALPGFGEIELEDAATAAGVETDAAAEPLPGLLEAEIERPVEQPPPSDPEPAPSLLEDAVEDDLPYLADDGDAEPLPLLEDEPPSLLGEEPAAYDDGVAGGTAADALELEDGLTPEHEVAPVDGLVTEEDLLVPGGAAPAPPEESLPVEDWLPPDDGFELTGGAEPQATPAAPADATFDLSALDFGAPASPPAPPPGRGVLDDLTLTDEPEVGEAVESEDGGLVDGPPDDEADEPWSELPLLDLGDDTGPPVAEAGDSTAGDRDGRPAAGARADAERAGAAETATPVGEPEPESEPRVIAAGERIRRTVARAAELKARGEEEQAIAELDALAGEFAAEGDLVEAVAVLAELTDRWPDELAAQQRRVEYAFRLGRTDLLVPSYLGLAGALMRSGNETKASAVYQRVLDLDPQNADARAGLAPPPAAAVPASPTDGYVDLGSWLVEEESAEGTRFVVPEAEPTGDEEKDFAAMLSQFRAKVADNVAPEDWVSHYDLGLAYKEMGLVDEAIAEFQTALRGGGERLKVYEELGQCFLQKGQYTIAVKLLKRGLEMPFDDDADLVGVYYQLGLCYEAMEKPDEARESYERVISLDIAFRDVNDRLSRL